MPYISASARTGLDAATESVRQIVASCGVSEGELHYILTSILLAWLPRPYHYRDLLVAYGTAEAVSTEFYRRVVAPYEDYKAAENGDLYL